MDLASELRLSVLIPTRNEARTLPRLLAALKRQSLQPLDVLVVDDHSSDATAAIAQAAGAALLTRAPLPAGWTGKNWALHQASQASSGDLLAFLDADTQPGPHVLARICGAQRQLGGLVSVQPFHRTERPYEQLSMLFNLVVLMAVPVGGGGQPAVCHGLQPALPVAAALHAASLAGLVGPNGALIGIKA